MHNLDSIRCLVRDLMRRHGGHGIDHIQETILVRGGYYCGRRFSGDGLRAVWFAEEGQVKLYDAAGKTIEVCVPGQEARNRQRVA